MVLPNYALISEAEFDQFVTDAQTEKEAHEEVVFTIDMVSKAIAKYCRREFMLAQDSWVFHGDGKRRIWTRQYPLVVDDPTHPAPVVWWDKNEDGTWSNYATDNNITVFYKTTGEIYLSDGAVFPKGFNNIKLVYSAGYDPIDADTSYSEAIPTNLKFAAILWCKHVRKQADGRLFGMSSEMIDGQTRMFQFDKMPKVVAGMLEDEINRRIS